MQRAALGVGEVVALVICNQIDDGALGESGRFVENEPPFLNTGSKRAHDTTVGRPAGPSKHPACQAHVVRCVRSESSGSTRVWYAKFSSARSSGSKYLKSGGCREGRFRKGLSVRGVAPRGVQGVVVWKTRLGAALGDRAVGSARVHFHSDGASSRP